VNQQPLLFWGGAGMFALAALFAALVFLKPIEITGVNGWLKPLKFAVSIGIYYWTIAFLLQYVPGAPGVRLVSTGTFVLLAWEIVCIGGPAARGVRSHFNDTTAFDGLIFGSMGMAITAAILLAAWLTWLFFTEPVKLPPAYLLGIRLGLILFVAASFEGFAMVARLSHSVGVPDGGPGLPLVNWSTRGGDLRIPHFLGMHALQILPMAGYFLADKLDEPLASRCVIALAALMILVTVGVAVQALSGRPLIRL
jgi:hypothetical protein